MSSNKNSTLMQVAMNCSHCMAILMTKDIIAVPGSLWVGVFSDVYTYQGALLPVELTQRHPISLGGGHSLSIVSQ